MGNCSTVIDWGCGLNHSPISKQVRDIDCDLLLSIDAWPEYVERSRSTAFKAKRHQALLGDMRAVALKLIERGDHTDLSLCLDVIEHLPRDDALNFLSRLEIISDRILVGIPLGYAPNDRDTYGGENHCYHAHRSTWTRDDFTGLGYACEVVKKFHSRRYGHRVDAGWACKKVR
ncbi:MAG: hypothetical protein M1305_06460 [Candidatus Marsarchaeota archaeon]|nr:hypothetical protein [Candidatus Marsarchaeota archaeon]